MRTTPHPAAPPRPFTWSVQSSDIAFMREESADPHGCTDCGDCGCVVPWDPPSKRKAPAPARQAGGARARRRP